MQLRRTLSWVPLAILIVTAAGRVGAAPPATPTPLNPANGASVTVPFTISWSAVSDPAGINGYNWQISTSSSFSTLTGADSTAGNVTQATVSGLTNGTYFWRVQAANGSLEQSAWSAPRSFTVTGTASGTPGTPTLDPTVGYSTFHPWESVSFTWSEVPGAAEYFHMVSNDPNFPVGPAPPGVTTFWTDNISTTSTGFVHALDEGTWYAKVYAVSADGIFSLPSNIISYTVFYNNPVPAAPVLISPINNPTLNLPFALKWNHVVNPQPMGYEVQVSANASFTNNETPLGVQLTNPEFLIKTLTSGAKFWRVRSHHGLRSQNPDGSTTNAVTAWSATGTFTLNTAPPRPVSVMPVRIPLYSGDDTFVEVQLTAGVPSSGATIALSSSNQAVAPVPATIQMQGTHALTQFQMVAGQVTSPTLVTLTATLNGGQASSQFTVNPPSLKSLVISGGPNVSGGTSIGGILSLNGQAPAGGATVNLQSNSPAVNPPPAVTIPAGVCCVPLSMSTSEVSSNTPVTITASWHGASVQSQVTVRPTPAPTSISLFPSTTNGGEGSVDGTVNVASTAPYDQFLRVTSNSAVVASTTAMVSANDTRGFFTLMPGFVSQPTVVTISVSGGGVTRSANLTVNPSGTPPPGPTLSSFTVSPTSVAGGTPATGTVRLATAAPAGGSTVTLGSNQPGAASVPASVTVPAGGTTANFTITTFPNAGTTVQLNARLGDTILFSAIGVGPGAPAATLSSVSVNPTSVVGGNASTATVALSAAAPSGGAVVSLSENSTATSVPASVTVPAGATNGNVTVTTTSVTASTSATISAVFGGVTRTVNLTVNPSTSSTPAAPTLGSPANDATVAQPVTLDWNDVANAASYQVQVDTSSTISSPFTANATVTASQTTLSGLPAQRLWWRVRGRNAAGTAGAWSSVRRFTPQAAPGAATLSSVAVSPSSVVGGSGSTGTATLTSSAPSGGALVSLSSSDAGAASVPGSVTIAAGATSATFTATTSAVGTSRSVTISAVHNGVTRTATFTVNPAGQAATLAVTATGRSGERVTSSPAGINVNVGSTGSASFATGTSITLSVTNGRDAIWSGACSSGGSKTKTCTLAISGNVSVTANVQ